MTQTIIDYVELPAVSMTATKDFYTAAFGWAWVDFGPNYAGFDGAQITVGLNTEATPAPPHDAGSENSIGPLVLFSTDDLEAAEERIRAAGADLISPPYDYPGGRRFHFRDPSGNILGVYAATPPADAQQ